MAYHHESRPSCRATNGPSYRTLRHPDAYSDRKTAMRTGVGDYATASYPSTPYEGYHPRVHDTAKYRARWPPSPSVEDETWSLARELPSPAAGEAAVPDGEAAWRGTVDQVPIIQDVEQPTNDERRFVLVSSPQHHEEPQDSPPLFTKRTSTPYAYTNPRIHTQRTPAPYSFVKSDLPSLSSPAPSASASSSWKAGTEPPEPPEPRPVETHYKPASPRPPSPRHNDRPSSPPSSHPPPRRPPSRNASRPSSRSGPPPSPPLSSQAHLDSSPRALVTEADWHATYPPPSERSRPSLRPTRYDTMPVPMPQINVKSPSPARQYKSQIPLPYPADDRPVDAYMPPEDQYQHDHSFETYTPVTSSPRHDRFESPLLGLDRGYQAALRPQRSGQQNPINEIPYSPRIRSDSVRSPCSNEGDRRNHEASTPLSLDRPLPSCPRLEPSSKHKDWYTLEGCSILDVCPSCYDAVFSNTSFAGYFSQTRRHERPVERFCDFGSSPWIRLAWMLTMKQRRKSPDLLYNLVNIIDQERDCPGDRELGIDHITWYGISDPRDGVHVNNFAICASDLRMIEELFPSIRGYFTRLPATTSHYAFPTTYTCSFRIKSGRFPKYIGLLVELDAEAQTLKQHPRIARFVQLARENAFKTECQRERTLLHKAWHFIPALPELTVCQECFEELIWPYLVQSSNFTSPSTVPKLFNRTIQPVPDEDPELGSSCCLYSPRMRRVWERAVRDGDFGFLEKKAIERKRAEARIGRERRDILGWMDRLERGTWEWEKAKVELKENEAEWKMWE